MVNIDLSIQERTDLILDKIDKDMALSREEELFYYTEIIKIKSKTWINFTLNGCDIPDLEKPANPAIGYEI